MLFINTKIIRFYIRFTDFPIHGETYEDYLQRSHLYRKSLLDILYNCIINNNIV